MSRIAKIVITVQLVLIVFLVLLLTGVLDYDNSFLKATDYVVQKLSPDDWADNKENLLNEANSKSLQNTTKKNQGTLRNNEYNKKDFSEDLSLRNDAIAVKKNPVASYDKSFRLSPPSQKSDKVTINLRRIQEGSSSLLAPQEIYSLDVSDDLWGYFQNPQDRIEKLKKIDKNISLVDYRTRKFKNSRLAQYLKLSPKTRIYVLLEFTKPINPEIFYTIRSLGFRTVPLLNREHYYRKHAGMFYVSYGKLRNIYSSSLVKNIHIIKNYTAASKYQLGIKSSDSVNSLEFKINYPYSKPGLKVSGLTYKFRGNGTFQQIDNPDRNQLTVTTSITKDALYSFSSQHQLEVSLLENLKRSFVVSAKNISLKQYHQKLESAPVIKDLFTRQGEKIVSSDYVKNILNQVNTNMDLSGIWKQITFILDKDIEYDWQKRDLFFSGNLTYYNIKDMYLNVEELSKKKVGACTERTSLEIAILRELGIAARSATRVYHIFTEIYLPQKGWLTTSLILNEIPLCHSYDEKMAYFVEWNQEFPIRLKWVGKIVPNVLKDVFFGAELARK